MTSINLAAVYQSRANYPEALDFLQQALVILREEKERYGEAVILNNMGEIYRGFGQARHALSYFEKARSLFDVEGDRFAVGIAVANIGAAYDALGEYSQALEFYQEALAIDALESLRPGLSDRNKISIFDKYRSSYGILQRALLAQNQIETALEVSERGRARAFVELIARRVSPEAAQEYANQKISSPTIAEIKQVAAAQNATLVEYSIAMDNKGENSQLLIWVVKPTGEIHARQVELSSLEQYRDNLVPFLVRGEPDGNLDSLLTALVRGTRADLAEPRLSIPADRVKPVKLKKLHELLIK